MADWGIRISKEGFDVKTCADYDLVMSSKFDLLKTQSVGTTAGTVSHGLGYMPVFFANAKSLYTGMVGQMIGDSPAFIDTNNIYAGVSGTIKYYIFYNQL